MKRPRGTPRSPAIVTTLQSVKSVVTAYSELEQCRAMETTKRAAIEADLRKELARIRSQRELVLTGLERSFEERRKLFEELFLRVDRALELGGSQELATLLGAVVELARSSPFQALQDLSATRKALQDPGSPWDV